ncbi:MAG: hypothetical protein L6266_04060 [Nanoarchaeota archaeon]|nr:hypothetical protein [Nanoarchaeota archaeon]
MKYTNKQRVMTLLINFNKLLLKITKLKIKNRQALGLLAEALKINNQILSLLKESKVSVNFVKETTVVVISIIKEIISKWLFRYKLMPLLAIGI